MIHATSSVEADDVALNRGPVRAPTDADPVSGVAGDDIAFSGQSAADDVVGPRARVDGDSRRIGDDRVTGRVQADVVVADPGAGRAAADLDAGSIPRDHVAGQAGAADDRPLAGHDVDANAAVGDADRAG